ncbi:hypothetical protein PsorP6_016470 [Peronosclerospora sorghi]|uniref:Uncharacterized protein n=1 Tax=Peronosclerospora sorghi TaxID=230839 RepID=A0ACC0VSG9_9STRA|nr:hypothetical protein PsorP6_016470 [Peronosclerospora sorghi]
MFAFSLAITLAMSYTDRTAVLLESPLLRDTHSENTFSYLKLSFFTGNDKIKKTLELERFGERIYENISDLLNFVEIGGNVLLSASKVQRNFAFKCGVEFNKIKHNFAGSRQPYY